VDFENALAYGPDRDLDRLHLAEALIDAKRPAEARARLLTLWTEQPGNGPINLQLARLAAADNDLGNAMRYYHAAIDGAWETGATTARRGARLELVRLLLARGQRTRAQSELIALIDDLPPDPALVTDVGELFVQAGVDTRAVTLFERALDLDPKNARAARLAAEAEYRLGDYRQAQRDFQVAQRITPLAPEDRSMLEVSGRVLAMDPYRARLSIRERARRILETLAAARDRFGRCQGSASPGTAPDARVADLASRLQALAKPTRHTLERDPDAAEKTMDLVADITRLPESMCGPATVQDRALEIIVLQRANRTS
jgi:tetratricopeptide (TPR) repeat protein